MGSIIERKRADGTVAYLAQVSVKIDNGPYHRESQTFERRKVAEAWVKKRDDELRRNGVPATNKARRATLGDAIDKYVEHSVKQIGRTKAQVLRSIKEYEIAEKVCSEISSDDIFAFARELSGARQPSTVANYLSHLAAVFAIADSAWKIPLREEEMSKAIKALKRLGITGKSNHRERRPTLDELNRILELYEDRTIRNPRMAPMVHIVVFAIFSTRRQEEIFTIRWDDLDVERARILVRDMKNPGEKMGNNVWCSLPSRALDVLKVMPRVSDKIFPYNHRSVSASFTRITNLLGIDNLHFHDLRHEGISHRFEMGETIPQVADVSGHRSWNSLKRYSHMGPSGDKYEGWPWLTKARQPPFSGVGQASGDKAPDKDCY